MQWEQETVIQGVLTAFLPGNKSLPFVQGQLCLSVTQLSWGEVMELIILQALCMASSQLSADLQPAFPTTTQP